MTLVTGAFKSRLPRDRSGEGRGTRGNEGRKCNLWLVREFKQNVSATFAGIIIVLGHIITTSYAIADTYELIAYSLFQIHFNIIDPSMSFFLNVLSPSATHILYAFLGFHA